MHRPPRSIFRRKQQTVPTFRKPAHIFPTRKYERLAPSHRPGILSRLKAAAATSDTLHHMTRHDEMGMMPHGPREALPPCGCIATAGTWQQ